MPRFVTPPEHLNGYPVIGFKPAATPGDAPSCVVLVSALAHLHPGHEEGSVVQYAVASWWPALGHTWASGDYHDGGCFEEALAAFCERKR